MNVALGANPPIEDMDVLVPHSNDKMACTNAYAAVMGRVQGQGIDRGASAMIVGESEFARGVMQIAFFPQFTRHFHRNIVRQPVAFSGFRANIKTNGREIFLTKRVDKGTS